MTLWQGLEIFKKCLLIDEDQLLKVLNRAPSQTQVIKNYLKELGQFLGGLTIAQNRPILAREIDLKQLLIESYQFEKMKLVVTFVCRILKESEKSTIFKVHNPWINANLQILRELNDYSHMTQQEEIN
jgi:CCR4-NOT transcription complex subunit 1